MTTLRPPGPLVAYLAGLVVVQYAIALGALEVARRLQPSGFAAPALRAAGVVAVSIGAAFFTLNAMA